MNKDPRFELVGRSSGISVGISADRRASFSSSEASSRVVAGLLLQGSAANSPASRDSAESAARSLFEALQSGGNHSFVHAFSNLSDSQQQDLRRRFGDSLDRFRNLSKERDLETLYLNLLALGHELGQGRDNSLAGAILHTLAESTELPSAVPEALRSDARAMLGEGSVWRRLEHIGKESVQQISDLGIVIPIGVGGVVSSAFRLGVLSRLAASPVSWYSRGFAAGAFASSVAFPAEVLSVWGTQQAYGQFTRSESLRQDAPTPGHELGSLALTFSLQKLSGAVVGGLFDRVHGINALTGEVARLPQLTRLSRGLFQQVGAWGGVAAGSYAEMRLGWRSPSSPGNFWTDSLVTSLQFQVVGSQFPQEILGPRHAARMQEMVLRTQHWEGPRRFQSEVGPFPGMLPEAAAAQGTRVFSLGGEGPSRAHILLATSHDSASPPRGRRETSAPPTVSSRPSAEGAALHSVNRQHFEQLRKRIQDWNARFEFLQSQLAGPIPRHGNSQERRAASRLLPSVDLKYLETLLYCHGAATCSRDDKGFLDRFTDIDRRLQLYIEKEPFLREILDEYSSPAEPNARTNPLLTWERLRAHLVYLGRRRYLSRKTVNGMLSNWFAPAQSRSTSSVQPIPEAAVAGMIDFICRETHTEEIWPLIPDFIGEVVRRRDEGMMENLAVYFQQYHLGAMRKTEVYDRFLKAISATGLFYDHPGVRGPFLELFEKLQLGNRDNRALQAATILQRSGELLAQGFDRVTLLRRGNHWQSTLLAQDPRLKTRTIAVTSIARPLASRENLETSLNHAERGLLQNGELLRNGDPNPNGKGMRILSIQIPRFGSETIQQDAAVWARDYLEEHPDLSEIHLVIPKEGNNADPFRSEFFQTVQVTRSMPTTRELIRNLEFSIGRDPGHTASRLELHRLRDGWARHLFNRKPDLKADVAGSLRRLRFFRGFIDEALGVKVDPALLLRVVDLRSVGFDIRDLDLTYGDRGLRLQAAVIPGENILRQAEQERSLLPPKLQKEHGTNRGSLSFHLSRARDSGDLQVRFDFFSLPPHLRGYGAGPKFFAELVYLSQKLGATSIVADNISRDYLLAFARYGVQYKTPDEFHRKGMMAFYDFLVDYQWRFPHEEFSRYDIRAASKIRSPRDIADAHFDPITKSLKLTPWFAGGPTGQVTQKPLDKYRVGRLFWLHHASPYDGFFGLEDDGYSMRTFRTYLRRRF